MSRKYQPMAPFGKGANLYQVEELEQAIDRLNKKSRGSRFWFRKSEIAEEVKGFLKTSSSNFLYMVGNLLAQNREYDGVRKFASKKIEAVNGEFKAYTLAKWASKPCKQSDTPKITNNEKVISEALAFPKANTSEILKEPEVAVAINAVILRKTQEAKQMEINRLEARLKELKGN